jgi:ABC-type Fe3+-citrate transport system substrate-binding protein
MDEQPRSAYLTNPLAPVMREALRVVWAAELYRESIIRANADAQVVAHRKLLDAVESWRDDGFWKWLAAVDNSPVTLAAIQEYRD